MKWHTECDGGLCPVHNPSGHPLRGAPILRGSLPVVERVCPHGIGHPDPDGLDWLRRQGHDAAGVHGCDGCCTGQHIEPTKEDQ